MGKWVFVCKVWQNFTYGKVYEGELEPFNDSILNVPNDKGELCQPSLYGIEECGDYKSVVRRYGAAYRKVQYFVTLEEWRESKINEIIEDED